MVALSSPTTSFSTEGRQIIVLRKDGGIVFADYEILHRRPVRSPLCEKMVALSSPTTSFSTFLIANQMAITSVGCHLTEEGLARYARDCDRQF